MNSLWWALAGPWNTGYNATTSVPDTSIEPLRHTFNLPTAAHNSRDIINFEH